MENFMVILTILVSYLLGSISSAVIISKMISGEDIRDHGSGNAGATNMLRVHGKLPGILTLICDILKGVVAVALAMLFALILSGIKPDNTYGVCLKYIAGLFVVLGHDFPIFFKFRGGKGVATSFGVMLMINWQIALVILVVALLVMLASRYVSLGSIVGGVMYPILMTGFIIGKGLKDASVENQHAIVTSIIMALVLIIKHRSNIRRIARGTESKLFSKKKKESAEK